MKDFLQAVPHPSIIIQKLKLQVILVRDYFYVYMGVKLGPVPRSYGSMFPNWRARAQTH